MRAKQHTAREESLDIAYLTHDEYLANARHCGQWKSHALRWPYHQAGLEIIQKLNLHDPTRVLEIGSFGAGLVHGSVRMDMPRTSWEIEQKTDIQHDAKVLPWPVEDQQYDLLIALRVWHHLAPVQRESFMEARRVARYVLIECPEHEIVGTGIQRQRFTEWNGSPPLIVKDFMDWGLLYLFGGQDA